MFCSYCGNRLTEGARFCSMCGSKVALAVEVTEEPDAPVVQKPEVQKPEVIVDEAAVARAEAKATAAVPPESREVPATQPAAPVRTRIAFDWSNVKDEPQKKQILNVKSPWDETGGFDEEALYKEMTPSTDRSRTMNFIDVLKAEREENKFETPAAPEAEFSADEKHDDEPPRLHFAPLYEDFDTPVKTPFDEPEHAEQKKNKVPEEKDAVDIAPVHKAEPSETVINDRSAVNASDEAPEAEQPAEKPAWHWFEMPDFLKSKPAADEPVAPKKETAAQTAAAASSSTAAEFRFQTPESALFEEPKYEDVPVSAEPETHDVSEDGLFDAPADMMFDTSSDEEFDEPEADYSEYEKYEEYADYADYSEYETPDKPEIQFHDEPVKEEKPEAIALEAVTEPEQKHEDYTYVYDEEVSDAESDYSDYINMDMSRASSDDGSDGRAVSQAAPEETYTVTAEPEEPAVYEPEPAPEPEAAEIVRTEAVKVPEAESQSLENDLADIIAAGAQKPVIKEEETESAPVDEKELFAEMEETAPKKKGMTIAAPAEEESEVEALKRRLAELTGAPEPVQSNEPEIISLDEAEPVKPAESGISISVEIKNAEPAEPEVISLEGTEPEVITLEETEHAATDKPEAAVTAEETASGTNVSASSFEEMLQAAAAPVTETDETDPVLTFEDELSKFLSDDSETDSKTPVYGLTPFSELEEELKEEAAAAEAEPEVITLTGPEADDSADILEAIAGTAAAPELVASEPQPVTGERSGVIDLSPAPEKAAAEVTPQATDALSLEDLETDLFGETPSPDAEAEVTKKIDKFYTLYRKNEEFQRLLDEEYSKLKTESHPAAVESSKPAPAGTTTPPAREVEDVTIYQELTPEEQKALAEAEAAQAVKAEVQAAVEETEPRPAEVKAAPVEWEQIEADAKAAAKKETRKEKKERKRREKEELKAREAAVDAAASGYEYEEAEQGSVFLTIVAVIIAILLVILLAIILVLNFAPDSGIALQIDSVIENITSHFSATANTGGQYLL